jgi:hypothetical protein
MVMSERSVRNLLSVMEDVTRIDHNVKKYLHLYHGAEQVPFKLQAGSGNKVF